MKLIGITGMSGSGKTTFSNMLAQYPEIGVIHIDDIFDDIKLKYFKFFMKENNHGEKKKIDSKLKKFIFRNRILFNIFMRLRAKLIERQLNQQIVQLQNEGKKTIIIDDLFLQFHKCYKDLNLIIQMTRPYINRRKAVMERDGLTKEEMVAYDVAHYTGNYKECQNSKTIRVNNSAGKENLQAICEELYRKYLEPFKAKYKDSKQIYKACERTEIKIIDREEVR